MHRFVAPAREIKEYLVAFAREYDLYKNIKFETRVESATWRPHEAQWKVSALWWCTVKNYFRLGGDQPRDDQMSSSDLCRGGASQAVSKVETELKMIESGVEWRVGDTDLFRLVPDFPGAASFSGPVFHTATWDHSVPLAGARVGLVGSAASAVQIGSDLVITTLAESCGSLL